MFFYVVLKYPIFLMDYFINCTTREEVKRRYKQLVFQHHPHRSKQDSTIYLEIKSAYEYLLLNPYMIIEGRQPLYCIDINKDVIDPIVCTCGSVYNLEDKLANIVECLSCSHFISLFV